jgi:ATP-dependent Clp protease ATP-binding subunit ClpA
LRVSCHLEKFYTQKKISVGEKQMSGQIEQDSTSENGRLPPKDKHYTNDGWPDNLDEILNGISPNSDDTEALERTAPRHQPAKPKIPVSKAQEELDKAVDQSIRDLSKMASEGLLESVYGRDMEMDRILSALRRKRRSNVLLHGAPGVGKTAMAEGLALRLLGVDIEARLADRPVWDVSLGGLVAGTKYRGDFEARIDRLVARAIEAKAILFIDEAHMLAGSGSTTGRSMDGANILKPALARGDFALIGATTTAELPMLTADRALMRRFEIMEIAEPNEAETLQILNRCADRILDFHDVCVDQDALASLVSICATHMPDKHFPDKAFDLLDQSCVSAREQNASELNTRHIISAARRMGARLPRVANDEMRGDLRTLSTDVAQSFPDLDAHDAFITSVSLAWGSMSRRTGCAGAWHLTNAHRSDAEGLIDIVAKALKLTVHHIDVSTILHRGEISRLIGNPVRVDPLEPRGELIEAVSRGSEQILHFCGMDKCDPAVADMLCNVASRGIATGADGRTHRATGAWIFLSEGSDTHRGPIGFGKAVETSSQSKTLKNRAWDEILSGTFEIGRQRASARTAPADIETALRDIVGIDVQVSARVADHFADATAMNDLSACDALHEVCSLIACASAGLSSAPDTAFTVTFASDGCILID